MSFPRQRLRRLRCSESVRRMVERSKVFLDDLIMPVFVRPGENISRSIPSMPGRVQFSLDRVADECHELETLGIPGVLLFGIPESKDSEGGSAWAPDGIVQQAIRIIKDRCENLLVITDVCMCEYTDHGHCGLISEDTSGKTVVDNDKTLEYLSKIAVSHAQAGADIVAPSDMMDGRVGCIRDALDQAGCEDVLIMSYAAKFASAFYGPFREAAESPPKFGDRRGYQMDYHSGDQAMSEISLDIEEGADIVMIKPAMAYLDIVYRARNNFDVPIACYNVSGEYAMLKAAAQNGWLNEPATVTEALVGMKRAGADIIITYFAKDVAEWIRANCPVSTPDGICPGSGQKPSL